MGSIHQFIFVFFICVWHSVECDVDRNILSPNNWYETNQRRLFQNKIGYQNYGNDAKMKSSDYDILSSNANANANINMNSPSGSSYHHSSSQTTKGKRVKKIYPKGIGKGIRARHLHNVLRMMQDQIPVSNRGDWDESYPGINFPIQTETHPQNLFPKTRRAGVTFGADKVTLLRFMGEIIDIRNAVTTLEKDVIDFVKRM